MKYYQVNDIVHCVGEVGDLDGDQSFLVQYGWVLMTDEEIALHLNPHKTAEQIQAETNQEALTYLASTDWYVVRFSETGVVIPDDVKAKRQEARDAIK